MRRFVFRSPRLGFLAVGPASAQPSSSARRSACPSSVKKSSGCTGSKGAKAARLRR